MGSEASEHEEAVKTKDSSKWTAMTDPDKLLQSDRSAYLADIDFMAMLEELEYR